MMLHLLWAFGLQAWIAACVVALLVIAALWCRDWLHERRGDPS